MWELPSPRLPFPPPFIFTVAPPGERRGLNGVSWGEPSGCGVNWRAPRHPQILPSTIPQRGGKEPKNNSSLKPKRQTVTSADEETEKLEHSYTVGGNVRWGGHCGKQSGRSSEMLPRDPAISLLGMYTGRLKTQSAHTHTKSVQCSYSNTIHKNQNIEPI